MAEESKPIKLVYDRVLRRLREDIALSAELNIDVEETGIGIYSPILIDRSNTGSGAKANRTLTFDSETSTLIAQRVALSKNLKITDGESTAQEASALLQVDSTTKGVLVSRMLKADKLAIVDPANGLLIYQTDESQGFYYFDTEWTRVSSGGKFVDGEDKLDAVYTDGNVGIHTNKPTTELEVVGDITSKGTKWIGTPTGVNKLFHTVCYGNGLFVAVSIDSTDNKVMTSPDGLVWSQHTSARNNEWEGVVYGADKFVAVSNTGDGDRVMTSPDGKFWTAQSGVQDNQWSSIAYGGGKYVAIANTGEHRIMTSTNGEDWEYIIAPAENLWWGLTYGNGLFVAVAYSGVRNRVMTSNNGSDWTIQTTPAEDNGWLDVTYGNGLFVAVAYSGVGGRVMTSPNGSDWTLRDTPVDNEFYCITYGNGTFVAVSRTGTNKIITSPNGIDWTVRDSLEIGSLHGIAYGNGTFVAISADATDNIALSSGKTEENIVPVNNAPVIEDEEIEPGTLIGSTLVWDGDAWIEGKTLFIKQLDFPAFESESRENLPEEDILVTTGYSGTDKEIFSYIKNGSAFTILQTLFEAGSQTKNYTTGENGVENAVNWEDSSGHDGKGCYTFQQDNSRIVYSPSDDYTMLGDYTVEAWINPRFIGDVRKPFLGTYSGTTLHGFMFGLGGANLLDFYTSDSGWLSSGITIALDDEWKHVVYTRIGDQGKFYIDGILVATVSGAKGATSSGEDFHIGDGGRGLEGMSFRGMLDDIKIYNGTALSADQVLAHFQGRTNTIVSQETTMGDVWSAVVTQNDGATDIHTKVTNDLVIGELVSGDVGIGTDDPQAKLDVKGKVASTGLQINTEEPPEPGQSWTAIDNKGNGVWRNGNFLAMLDTPSDYAGKAGRFTTVNSAEDGLQFTESTSVSTVTFGNDDLRFFGELGLPSTQGWVNASTGTVEILIVDDEVFGATKKVVKHNDDNNDGLTRTQKLLSEQDWDNINNFGSSFGGVSRLDTVKSDGFQTAMMTTDADNPINTGKRRFGFRALKSGDYLKIQELENATNSILFDGSDDGQTIPFDEYFIWEVVIPVGLGDSVLHVNNLETTLKLTFRDYNPSEETKIVLTSGSTTSSVRVSYHDNFGVVIYTESNEKAYSSEEMNAEVLHTLLPHGKRNYTLIIPNDSPRNIGDHFEILGMNINGTVTIRAQDLAAPQSIINGFSSITLPINSVMSMTFHNTVDRGNVYASDASMPFGQFPGNTPRWDGRLWVDSDALQNDGTDITIKNLLRIKGGDPDVGKVLTSDGEGLSSWKVPTTGGATIPITNETTDATTNLIFVGDPTGNQDLHSNANLTFNSVTGVLKSTDLLLTNNATIEGQIKIAGGDPAAGKVLTSDAAGKGTWKTPEAGGGGGKPGIDWVSRSSVADNPWSEVTYGNGIFVAVSDGGSSSRVMTSIDGTNWTARTSASNNTWEGVAYGGGIFVAVSSAGSSGRAMTSPDGITWTSRTSAANDSWVSVTYGNGLFVAVAVSGTERVMTSPDGITWTSRTSAANNDWKDVTYGNGIFVAVAGSGTHNVMTSPDGITWTSQVHAVGGLWRSVIYGNGLFVAVSRTGSNNRIMTSPNGVEWTSRTNPVNNIWEGVTYGNGLFVAVAYSGTGNRVMTSPDGKFWTSRTSAVDNNWNGVTYGNGVFVAVSRTGSGNRVMSSGELGIGGGLTTSITDEKTDTTTRLIFANDAVGEQSLHSNKGITYDSSTETLKVTQLRINQAAPSVIGQVWTAIDNKGNGEWRDS